MDEIVFAWLMVAMFALGFIVIVKVEAAARRAERIYIARRRDHSKVPVIVWKSDV